MNRLTKEDRAQILHLLCEGNSIRAVTRLTGASKTTVTKLVVDTGQAAAWYQDRVLHNLPCRRLQLDEVWGFVGAKAKNAKPEKKVTGEQGDVWLWVATDADTKLVASWMVGGRNARVALAFTDDLAERLAGRAQITTDGLRLYVDAIATSFGHEVDFAQLVKLYGEEPGIGPERKYSPESASAPVRNGSTAIRICATSARRLPSATISISGCTRAA